VACPSDVRHQHMLYSLFRQVMLQVLTIHWMVLLLFKINNIN
jgi:hypothetical protein